MNILVTGANGMVGHAVEKQLKEHNLILTDIHNLDVTNYDAVMKHKNNKYDCIIHLAAETDLESCEKFQSYAYHTNTIAVWNVTKLAEYLDIPIVYISTAGVFNGVKKEPYTIHDKPDPINHYGRSKLLGEYLVKQYEKHYILRASWMMGGGPDIDKKFVNKIIRKIKAGHTEINVCDDVTGSPTYTVDLANAINYIIKKQAPYGLYHTAGLGNPSRAQLAVEIVNLLGLVDKVNIIPVKSQDVMQEFPCPRSYNEQLENNYIPLMRDWKITIKEYINDYFIN